MPNKSMRLKLILLLCRSRSPGSDSGLSMLEVLVAMMVVFLTFMTSVNGLLFAAMFQVKAERQAQATYWIQQDVENVKSLAASASTASVYTSLPACGGSTDPYKDCCKTTVSNGVVIGGFANKFNSSLPSPSASKKFLGKDYVMLRGRSISPTSPQVLKITYTVREKDAPYQTLATLYTEVMPSAALSCS